MKVFSTSCSLRRRGVTMLEVVVAAGLLSVAMGFATTMAFRTRQIWRDIEHARLASSVLESQMETLINDPSPPESSPRTSSQLESMRRTVDSLVLPAAWQRRWPEGSLTGEWIQDSKGTRLALRLQTGSKHQSPVWQLIAWLDGSPPASTTQLPSDNDSPPDTKPPEPNPRSRTESTSGASL